MELIQQAVRVLRRGGVVAFPTETVYGLGARLSDPKGIKKIYAVKGRPSDNPLIVHVSSLKEFGQLTRNVPPAAFKLVENFWPGPLTLVCKKTALVPRGVTAGLDTVAVRMPQHPVALKLLKALGEPIAAPSANRSGRPSPTRYEDVRRELKGKAGLILDGGRSRVGLESTVLDLTRKPFRILRPGCVSLEDLRKVIPGVAVWGGGASRAAAPSPGMKHRHYQPHCKVVLARPEEWSVVLSRWIAEGGRLGGISFSRPIPLHPNVVFRMSFKGDARAYARGLYAHFFEAEKAKVQVLVVESMEEKGVGRAVMDRLARAATEL